MFAPRLLGPLAVRVARTLRPERLLDLLLRVGPYGLTLAKLRASPHGVDLGPLQAGRIASRIATADGKVDIAPDDFLHEARGRLLAEANRNATGELVLIGRRQLGSNNSWMHNADRLVKGHRCTLLVHPQDAEPRNIATGDMVQLTSETGTVMVPVEVTDAMLPGVVSLPHGWGHDRDGVRLRVAREHAGASVNDVTDDRHLDTLSGNAAFNGLEVTVQALTRAREGESA